MLTFKEFQQAKDTVEKIVLIDVQSKEIQSEEVLNEIIKITLREGIKGINKQDERIFYNLMGSLFRNVIINRLDELGQNAKKLSMIGKRMIAELMHEKSPKGELKYV